MTCINEIAKTHSSGLEDYGVSAELIDNVAVLNDRFNRMIGRPRSIIQARKRANQSIPLYIAKAEVRAAKEELLDAHKAEELGASLAQTAQPDPAASLSA